MRSEKQRALISTYDKEGVVELARELVELGYEIVSTGGTFKVLHEAQVPVTRISEVTGFPEILDGRVKTLHPLIHGGILARNEEEHLEELKKNDIGTIDVVVVNLYPFEKVAKDGGSDEDLIQNIDIGGPTMVRAAAKNFEHVIILTSPEQYGPIVEEMKKGEVSQETRKKLATKAFLKTCTYDKAIFTEFGKRFSDDDFPQELLLHFHKLTDMRYGENPHQAGAFYGEDDFDERSIVNAKQLHGKKLSFNNILDANDALELVKDFERPTATVVKHTNPCGVASADDISTAYELALEADPMSAFGGVIAVNRPLAMPIAEHISNIFVELVIAPSYEPGTLELLTKKKNIRLIETGVLIKAQGGQLDLKRVVGGILVQDRNIKNIDIGDVEVISERQPTNDELVSMEFAWRLIKHVKSNSVIFTKGQMTTGIGAGQMSRVDAVKIASFKAKEHAKGSVMASDAFFPFRDGIDEAAKAGITAVIQPGGSIKDREVIDAVNQYGMAMVFTGIREFKH